MRSWQLQLKIHRTGRKAHLRLFGLVLVSIAIHLTLILFSSPMRLEQSGKGSPALQIRMSAIHDEVKRRAQPTPQAVPSSPKVAHKAPQVIKPAPVEKTPSPTTVTLAPVKSPPHKPATKKQITAKMSLVEKSEPLTQTEQTTATPTPPPTTTTTQVTPLISDEQASMANGNTNTHERDEITRHLQQALARHFKYPFIARRRGWQGEVIIAFTLESDGRIMDIRIANGSGHSMLDRAALASLNKVGRIEQAPAHALSFELPVIYRLQKG